MHLSTGVRSRPWYQGAGLVMALALVLSLLVPAAGGGPAAQAASRSADAATALTIAAQTGVPNQPLAITGTNFITNTPITIDFVEGAKHTTLAMLTLSGGADFTFTTAVPLAATPGTAYIEACYSTSSCNAVVAFASFTVIVFGAALTPNPALPGQTVTIAGTGFAVAETVSVTLGTALVFAVTTSSDAAHAGSFGGTFSAPLAAGVYTVTATGLSSGYQYAAPLTVQAPPASTSTPVPPTGTALPTSTGTAFPTATATAVPPTATSTPVPPAATSTPVPANTATALPTSTPVPCSGSACTCPRGTHRVADRCVSNATRIIIYVVPVHPRPQVRVIVHVKVRVVVKTKVVHRKVVITPRPRVHPRPAKKVVIIKHGKGHGKGGKH